MTPFGDMEDDVNRTPEQDLGYLKGVVRGIDRRVDDLQVNMDRRLDEQSKMMKDMKGVLDGISTSMEQQAGSASAYKRMGGFLGAIGGAIAGAVSAHMFRGAP